MSKEVLNYRDKKYRDDTVFQKINKKYLTLCDEDKKIYNQHLQIIRDSFIPLLQKDDLFAVLFNRIMYGGSYYKGTRVGKPEEFDLDFVIKLPINYKYIKIDTNHNNYSFVKIKLDKNELTSPTWIKHSKVLCKWLSDDGYLYQDKFRSWMERVFTLAFSGFNKTSDGYDVLHCEKKYKIKHKKSGPAYTIIITTPEGHNLDIDVVPCLEFDNVTLNNGYKKLNGNIKRNVMVVAKPLDSTPNSNVLWRLCFYEQEKEFLQGDIKPVIRMMKKFRDTQEWKPIASYFIETIFYHEIENHKNDIQDFLKAPKAFLFILGLKRFLTYLERKELPYFWHPNYNLFGKINPNTLQDYAFRLKKIIANIDKNIELDRYVLADIVLTYSEASLIRREKSLGSPPKQSVADDVPSKTNEFVSHYYEPQVRLAPIADNPSSDNRWCVIL